jgi:HEPN domain-containing protein
MPVDPEVISTVQQWVMRAESDLVTAICTLQMPKNHPTDTICFHAQQCVEKHLKALLTLRGIDFPKTHRLRDLLHLLAECDRPDISAEEQEKLTDYATMTRYPGDYELIPLGDAKRAVAVARRVRTAIRRMLPKEALRRKRA